MKAIGTNGNNIQKSFEVFSSIEEKNNAVNDFFAEFEHQRITTHVIGYLLDEVTGEKNGYIEENYVDNGSVDHYYTALIF